MTENKKKILTEDLRKDEFDEELKAESLSLYLDPRRDLKIYHDPFPTFAGIKIEDSTISPKKNVIFSVTFSCAEILKQVFGFLHGLIDTCPFIFKDNNITIFKPKKNPQNPNVIVMLINIRIDTDQLYEYTFNPQFASNPEEECHSFLVNTGVFNDMAKNSKTKSVMKMVQYEGENCIRCSFLSQVSCAETIISVSEYFPEKCHICSQVISPDLSSNCNAIIQDFTEHCSKITKTQKISALVHFEIYRHGFSIFSENKDTARKPWGNTSESQLLYTFIIEPHIIKHLGCMKKFNDNGIVRIYAVDNMMLRIDTKLSCFGDVNLYITQNI
jgi:hypothetical protein